MNANYHAREFFLYYVLLPPCLALGMLDAMRMSAVTGGVEETIASEASRMAGRRTNRPMVTKGIQLVPSQARFRGLSGKG